MVTVILRWKKRGKNNRILNSILVWLGADFGEVRVFWEARFALPISASG